MSQHGEEPTTANQGQPRRRSAPWRLFTRTLSKAWDGNIFSESAEAAFWQALSLAPLMLGLLGLLGYVGDWFGRSVVQQASGQIVKFSETIFSGEVVENIVGPTVEGMLNDGKGAIVSVGFLIALWAGSSAMSSFVDAITVAHAQYGVRNEVWQRIFALLLYMASLLLLIIGLPLIAIGPDLLPRFFPEPWRDVIATWVSWLYYPVLGVLLVLALATLYKLALPRKLPWHRGVPGAILAMAIFLLTSASLRFYLSGLSATGYTYGALATPVAFLLFLFFIGLAIVGGAYFNSAIEELWPAKPTRRQRRKWRRLELERVNMELHTEDDKGRRGRPASTPRKPRRPAKQPAAEEASEDDRTAEEPAQEAGTSGPAPSDTEPPASRDGQDGGRAQSLSPPGVKPS
ncbi:MAG: YihY/virulence factor BrkB family protein [Actinophytocola sp.]|nr:YihY/virulence factor BrkB family protein [Actinophytocola sp.]